MEILMLLSLLLGLIIAVLLTKKDLLNPLVIFSGSLLISYIIVILNYNNWDIDIKGSFIIYIITALISWIVGTLFGNLLYDSKLNITKRKKLFFKITNPNIYPYNKILVISIVTTLIYFFYQFNSVGMFSITDLGAALRSIYDETVARGNSGSILKIQSLEISIALGYITVYRICLDEFVFKYHKKANFIPVLCLFLVAIVSTDRNIFLRFIIFTITIWLMFYRKQYKGNNLNYNILIRALGVSSVAMLFFYIIGLTKQYTSSISRALGIYGGSGLYNFNLWIEDFNGPYLYGEMLFSSTINTLSKIFDIQHKSIPYFDPFIEFSSQNGYIYTSNIYSAFYVYVNDFGILGMIIIPFFMSIIYQLLYIKSKATNCGFWSFMYAMFLYPIVYMPILEQLFKRMHLGLLYEIGWIILLFNILYGRKHKVLKFVWRKT